MKERFTAGEYDHEQAFCRRIPDRRAGVPYIPLAYLIDERCNWTYRKFCKVSGQSFLRSIRAKQKKNTGNRVRKDIYVPRETTGL